MHTNIYSTWITLQYMNYPTLHGKVKTIPNPIESIENEKKEGVSKEKKSKDKRSNVSLTIKGLVAKFIVKMQQQK